MKAAEAASTDDRPLAVELLWFGAVGVILAVIPGDQLVSDRYAYPKELALHVFGILALVSCLIASRRLRADAVDALLAAFLLLGAASAAVATNPWFALRGLTLAASGVAVFWAARSLAARGYSRHLTAAAAVAVILGAATVLLEAQGVLAGLSEPNRGPGGTIGNRNYMACFLALGLPVLLLQAATARRYAEAALFGGGLAAVAAALVMSRSRAAWLAGIVVALVLAAGALRARRALRGHGIGVRLAAVGSLVILGAGFAVLVPNRLQWGSSTPYADTFSRLLDHQGGSGAARLVQSRNTARMASAHPLLGVGPGNWTIEYGRYASPNDPSYTPDALAPSNRLPHSDWLGMAAEWGLPALLVFAAAAALVLAGAWRELGRSEVEGERALEILALGATLAALGVLGALNPVLQAAAPAFLFFLVLGALARPGRAVVDAPLAALRVPALAFAMLAASVPVAYGTAQFWSGRLYGTGVSVERMDRALRIHPGDYRGHMLLADTWIRQGDCGRAAPHIQAAHELFPTALAPTRMRDKCRAREAPPEAPPTRT